MPGLDGFTVRPSVGTQRVDVICGRCKGPVRDSRLNGVVTVADIAESAEAHNKRLHRGPVITMHVTPAVMPL